MTPVAPSTKKRYCSAESESRHSPLAASKVALGSAEGAISMCTDELRETKRALLFERACGWEAVVRVDVDEEWDPARLVAHAVWERGGEERGRARRAAVGAGGRDAAVTEYRV
eukprot:1025773-Pleurochrysis_carterae.AAC.3